MKNYQISRQRLAYRQFSIFFPICDSNKAAGKSQQSILYFNLFPTILVRAMIRKRKTRSLKTEIIARSHQWCAPGFLRCYICFFLFSFFAKRFHSFDLWAVASVGAIFHAPHCDVHVRGGRLRRFARSSQLTPLFIVNPLYLDIRFM